MQATQMKQYSNMYTAVYDMVRHIYDLRFVLNTVHEMLQHNARK